MNKKLVIFLTFIGLIGLFSACEKDETKVVMLSNPVAPTIQTVPDLTLKRANGTQTLTFTCTPVDPGFQASATYFLEACEHETNFANPITIKTGVKADKFEITVSDLNVLALKNFPADQATSIDIRLRAVLTLDAGTGYTPLVYSSAIKTVNITPYGLPRLDLIDSGVTQKIESALGDGKYAGFVKLDATKPFTLKDPDTNKVYGGSGNVLSADGAGIVAGASGWYKFAADVNAMTYTLDPYMIGLVGSATPNGWDSPDQKMDYDAKTGSWKITIDLIDGEIKFRLNDGWAWNLGGTVDNLEHNGANIPVTAGNYTITLTLTAVEAGKCTIVKN